ncbi:MAG: PDZ domain-containing protein [Deltaproteobacteria bacterium]|nr:PDZ domain-containing protein [Deltaproteobacteria bacterium]
MARRAPQLRALCALALLAHGAAGCKKQPRAGSRSPGTAATSAPPAPASPPSTPAPGDISGPIAIVGGPFVGFGMRLQGTSRAVEIAEVFDDSPASEAGLRAGDLIVAIDGESTLGWPVQQVMARLRGAAGTEASLDLERGIDGLQVRMVRRRVPSVPLPGNQP